MLLTDKAQDVAKEKLSNGFPIDCVGIKDLIFPISLDDGLKVSSKISVFVSVDDSQTRGIHMSRIYLAIHEYFKTNKLNLLNLETLLEKIIQGQKGISSFGKIKISFGQFVERQALQSQLSGWRSYPIFMEVKKLPSPAQTFEHIIGGTVTYSSTCPCSTSLSRQIIKNKFEQDFPQDELKNKKEVLKWIEENSLSVAIPHAQKSTALFKLKVSKDLAQGVSALNYIDEIEKALGTAVQVAVKRQDEAEFAKLNANNLMFCEDAIRKIITCFENKKDILDYCIKVQHYESLHPFTVQSSTTKGTKNGWKS